MADKFTIVRNAIDKNICDFLSLEFQMMEEIFENLYPNTDFSDSCKNSFARYSPLMFEALSIKLLPLLEERFKKKLFPTYSYARIYYKNSELVKHKDRLSSEVTVSACIEKDESNWPLFLEIDNNIHEIHLDVGDIVIYSGKEYSHWREPFTGIKQVQAFMQYVYADGENAWLKYDTRPCLGLPYEWTSQAVKDELKTY